MSDTETHNSAGIVVEHKESHVRYATLPEYYDEAVHVKIRDLKPGETLLGYQPKAAPAKTEKTAEAKSVDKTPATPDSSKTDAK